MRLADNSSHMVMATTPTDATSAQLDELVRRLQEQNAELRYSQRAAEDASDRFEALFGSVPLPLMVVDEHDLVLQANPVAHRRFQPSEADRPLHFLTPFVTATQQERVRLALATARRDGHAVVSEVVFEIGEGQQLHTLRGDVHLRRIDNLVRPVVEAEALPEAAQFICAVVDQGPLLAERQALRERNVQLHASQARLASVINRALDAIVCVDDGGAITVFNPAACALFGCDATGALGQSLAQFMPDAPALLASARAQGQTQRTQQSGRTTTGQLLQLEAGASFERTDSADAAAQSITTVFIRDVTAQVAAQAERDALEQRLRDAQKMQAVGTMAGGIAHDFNNLLAAILGNLDLVQAELAERTAALDDIAGRIADPLAEAGKAGRRARELVRQILTFSRNEAPRRTWVDVGQLARDTDALLRVTLPQGVQLQLDQPHADLPADLPAIWADATQLQQAMLNLCHNAVQAVAPQALQGHSAAVQLRLGIQTADEATRQRLGLRPHGSNAAAQHGVDCLVITVNDNGPGMDAATVSRIFEPFFTTKPVGQGTGLGLSVVHGVAQAHHGAVDVASAPGRGSQFMLWLPLLSKSELTPLENRAQTADLPQTQTLPAASVAASATAPGPSAWVWVVDDDAALARLLTRVLSRAGLQVRSFTDAHTALAALAEPAAACDLLLTDFNMPLLSGVQVLQAARALRPGLRMALASGYVTPQIEREALAAGARALLHKPDDVADMLATVQALLAAP